MPRKHHDDDPAAREIVNALFIYGLVGAVLLGFAGAVCVSLFTGKPLPW